jgi:hypothetical protein
VLGLAALGFVAAGARVAWRGTTARRDDGPDPAKTPRRLRRWISCLGRLGSYAQAVTLLLVGVFLLLALVTADPQEARGLGGALRAVQHTTHGRWLLALIGAGFVSHGLYDLLSAAHRPHSPGSESPSPASLDVRVR